MQFQCPHCKAQFETQRSGRQFCPNCGQQIDVAVVGATAPGGPTGAPSPTSGPSAETGQPSMGGSGPPPGGEIPPIGPPPPGWIPPGGAPPPGGPPPPRGPSFREDTPWERRRELGFLRALVETWKQTVSSPDRFFSSVRPDGRWEDAFLYAWLLAVVTFVSSMILWIPFQAIFAEQMRRLVSMFGNLPPEYESRLSMLMGVHIGMQIWSAVFRIILWPIGMFIGAALVHLFCIVFGCATNGFWATFRALAYAWAPIIFLVLAPVPYFGWWLISPLALVFIIVLGIWAVMRLQDTTVGKAAAAVLATPVLSCCCCCGVSVLAGSALKSMLGGGR